MEREKLQFHRRVRKVFLSVARKEKKRFVVINAGRGKEEVTLEMVDKLNDRLPGPRFKFFKRTFHG